MFRKNNYKDMEKYRKTRNGYKNKYYGRTAFLYPKREWTEDEDTLVLKHDITDTELSVVIERSVSAIQKRRWLLKNDMKEKQI